jgi:amino acid transporter
MSEIATAPQLARNQVGLMAALFQSITSMAPGAAIAASIPLGAAFAGGALPLVVLIAFVGILFTAWSIGQLAKHIPAAGSVATYNAVGLSPWVGFPRRLGLRRRRGADRAARHAAARLHGRRRVELRAVVVSRRTCGGSSWLPAPS